MMVGDSVLLNGLPYISVICLCLCFWQQSKRKPSARKPQPSADRNIRRAAEQGGLNRGIKG